jgi:hypothetical protein
MTGVESPVLLEVLARVPTDFFHCGHCERLFDVAGIGESMHREVRTSYPPEMLDEAKRLSRWLSALSKRYGAGLQIRVVDVHSMEGFFKSLRHWLRRYPAFIVDREVTHVGWEQADLDQLLEARVTRRTVCDEDRGEAS